MSKINAVRFINLNYNHNTIKVSDDTFHLNGESTLLSLRNGGGKSVLVQMVMALFVHKRYRDAKDRPFESYFTTGKPTFILVEWKLDQGAGYVLTGMMVRRSQNMDGNQTENLDMVNIISEYRNPCLVDIHRLPVVEKGKKEMILKNFAACRQMFEEFKRDPALKFFYYDMANSAQSRQYFDKLMEYQINYKEWETIIKKVNLEESGLSNLFADCRDERGLVEKWFLDAVEGKLNKDKNRMKEFLTITEKYVGQYKDNQSKIKRRDTIRQFKEEGIRIEEKTLQYQEAENEKTQQENRIANFMEALHSFQASAEEKKQGVQAQLEEVRQEAGRVEYEKLSGKYYQIEGQQSIRISNRDMIGMEQEALERERKGYEDRLHLLACAKQQETVTAEKADLEEINQKLDICKRKNEDLTPERNILGYLLKCHYEALLDDNTAKQKEVEDSAKKAAEDIVIWTDKVNELELAIREDISKAGSLKSRMESYDEQEEGFKTRYKEALTRNILGNYEPGRLEILEETYKKAIEEEQRQLSRRRRQLEDSKEQSRSLERRLEEQQNERQQSVWEQEQAGKLHQAYEEELKVRSVILKYLGLGEEERFDTERIVRTSDRKLSEIAELKRNLEKEEDELQKEYKKLTQGKTLELPGELERELEDIGIHVTYGMEWLNKNGYPEEQNREIVRNHPFLPYGLILSGKELEKLSRHAGDVYTSFPIPIIRREQLDLKSAEVLEKGIVAFSNISFYVLFNDNLLNEEKLAELVREIEQKIRKKQEAAAIRDTEYREYFERRETVRNQEVSRERYAQNEEAMEEIQRRIEHLAGEIEKTSKALAEEKDKKSRLESEIPRAEKEIAAKERKMEDFARLCKAYKDYEQNSREFKRCQEDLKAREDKKALLNDQLEKLREQLRHMERDIDNAIQEEKELKRSSLPYADYREISEDQRNVRIEAMDTADQEARFKAITANMSQELQDLETQKQKASKRYQEAMKELERLRMKYLLEAQAWSQVRYDPKEETQAEIRSEDLQRKINTKIRLWNEENTQIAVLQNQMDACLEHIRADCGKEAPLPKADIQDKDFDAVKKQLEYRREELQKTADALAGQLQSCNENLTALAEYDHLTVKEPVEWEEPVAEMSREQLRNRKGTLVRDHKATVEACRDAREQLTRVLNQIVRMEAFAEEFYRKPLEAMLELTEDATQVLRQLHTTMQSYDNLMEKLEVDISIVEKEKEKIVELMEDYIKEVHLNLGKIDSNSTIYVRERPLKMLKIQLPEWEENANLYHIRLLDMMEEITRRGIELFEQNVNAQEYFGTQITTKNLYDVVIGISNVQVKLYKIEEQREYPITWADVAKNSGGEGFLSAFVILSSLLYYMRRDDTDFFADRNEGKVLIMDNPFAQTNASHLLRPLMDMAKKTNTQLICLTGLGGESIYNRFDNIYVLNLIAASLRNGMQYLKVDHLKGDEPETMVVSQIEVVEQVELEF